jgi:hypothetical protein
VEEDWNSVRSERGFPGFGLLRPVLLFGSAAIAIALMLVPILEDATTEDFADAESQGLDLTSTGSIEPSGGSGFYIVRRSVLQSPGEVCVIRANGTRAGDC